MEYEALTQREKSGVRIACVITAAGSGKRMGSHTRKQYLRIGGEAILKWTLRAFARFSWLNEIVLVVPPDDIRKVSMEIVGPRLNPMDVHIVVGASRRQDSVFRGLQAVHPDTEWVLIHDGVRPFVRQELVERLLREAESTGAAIPGIPARDTLKKAQENQVVHTVSREDIWQIQTPQVFRYPLILQAHRRAREENFYATDDASLLEQQNHPIRLVPGDPYNIKITTPEDIPVAERLLSIYFPEEENLE